MALGQMANKVSFYVYFISLHFHPSSLLVPPGSWIFSRFNNSLGKKPLPSPPPVSAACSHLFPNPQCGFPQYPQRCDKENGTKGWPRVACSPSGQLPPVTLEGCYLGIRVCCLRKLSLCAPTPAGALPGSSGAHRLQNELVITPTPRRG